jgi:hypothetical protein
MIYQGNEKFIEPKYTHCIDNLKEQINQRQKYLHNINDVELYEELACDENKFKQYLCKKYLILSREEFDKKTIEINNKDFKFIKPDEIIDKINTCFWFENLLKIKRFDVNNIKDIDLENIKKILNKEVNKFYCIFKNKESEGKTIKSIKNKINSIDKLNLLQKFIADCYNQIYNDSINIISKKIYIKKVYVYTEFIFKKCI